jgi:hypothetical protein
MGLETWRGMVSAAFKREDIRALVFKDQELVESHVGSH